MSPLNLQLDLRKMLHANINRGGPAKTMFLLMSCSTSRSLEMLQTVRAEIVDGCQSGWPRKPYIVDGSMIETSVSVDFEYGVSS